MVVICISKVLILVSIILEAHFFNILELNIRMMAKVMKLNNWFASTTILWMI